MVARCGVCRRTLVLYGRRKVFDPVSLYKEIAKMYEDNLRQLKSDGEKAAADGALTESLGKILAAA